MSLIRNMNHRRINNWILAAAFLSLSGNLALIRAQKPADEPEASLPSDDYLYVTGKGEVLAEGSNTAPIGPLKVKGYRLEEVKLPRPVKMVINGNVESVESVLRLVITGEGFQAGSYLLWIGDNLVGDVMSGRNKLTAVIINRTLLEEGATISVAYETTNDQNARTTLPDRLYFPPRARGTQAPDTRTNTITGVRRIKLDGPLAGKSVIEIELTSSEEFQVISSPLVIQVGEREYYAQYPFNGGPHKVFFRMSEEEFAKLPDGAPVFAKYGHGARSLRGARKFGRLNKSQLTN